MERSHTDTPGSSSPGGEPGPHFTDWREQLRDRVREIRARKLADKRADEAGGRIGETPDPAEQAAAARAEKLRAARESIEGSRRPRAEIEPEIVADASRIEQRVEAISEEVHEATHEDNDEVSEMATEAAAEWRRRLDTDREEALGIAARTDAGDLKLGNGDRSARRSEIADVVDSLLGGAPDESPAWDEEPLAASADAPEWEEEPFGIVAEATSDGTEEITEEITEQIEASEESGPLDGITAFEAAQERWDEETATDDVFGDNDEDDEIVATGTLQPATSEPEMAEAAPGEPEVDPFANAPAWARASFAPRKEPGEPRPAASDDSGIPPELEDVDIPSWALPRPADRRAESSADLFAATEEDSTEEELAEEDTFEEMSTATAAAAPELTDEAPLDAEPEATAVELFEPGDDEVDPIEEIEQIGKVERFAGQVEDDEEAWFDDPAIEAEADFEVDLDLSPESRSPEPKAAEPELDSAEPDGAAPDSAEPDSAARDSAAPDSAIAAAIDAAIQRRRPVQREQDPDGDVFLVGEFRTRGRIVPPAYEDAPPRRPDTAQSESPRPEPPREQAPEPVAARASSRRRPDPEREREPEPEPRPVAARTGLFDEERPLPERDEVEDVEVTAPLAVDEEIEWDLDTPDDPDTILDAQRADADPSAPVTDRIFSAVADAMVLLTIALLLAIAGAYAAAAPIVPFVQAAPLPFFLAVLLFGFAYGVFFTGTCGQTLGKMAMRVRVIGGDTFRIGYQRAAQRSLYYAVAALPVGLGLLPALRDPEHRALHDRLSNTRVVKA